MKRLTLALLCGSLLACKKEDTDLLQPFDLIQQQPTTIAAGGPVQATLIGINDSRCPSDVVCITAGSVTVTVTLLDSATTQTVRLGYDRSYTHDSTQVRLHGQSYWLRLLAVQPYPSTKNASQPKTATFRLHP